MGKNLKFISGYNLNMIFINIDRIVNTAILFIDD